MIDKLEQNLRFQSEALRLRSMRQETIAANIVNGETPGYKAKDFDFAKALQDAVAAPASSAGAGSPPLATFERPSWQPSLDGNTVDMDTERGRFADNALRYETALRSLNQQIKTLLSAIQG